MTPKCSPIVLSAALAIGSLAASPAAALAQAAPAQDPPMNLSISGSVERATTLPQIGGSMGKIIASIIVPVGQNNHDHDTDWGPIHTHDHTHNNREAIHVHVVESEFTA